MGCGHLRVLAFLLILGCGLLLAESAAWVIVKKGEGSPATDKHRTKIDESPRCFEYDEVLGWKGRASARCLHESGDHRIRVKLNSEGFRDKEFFRQKRDGRIRIVVLGDSQTWGYLVKVGERYTDILEGYFRQNGIDAEVFNFGQVAYGTDQELLLFNRTAVKYQPDIVILGFYWNDIFENMLLMAYGYPKPRFRESPEGNLELENVPLPRSPRLAEEKVNENVLSVFKSWLRRNSFLYGRLEAAVRRSVMIYPWVVKVGLAGGPRTDPESPEWKVTRRLLGMLKKSVEDHKGKFLVIMIPDRAELETASHLFKQSLIDEMKELPGLDLYPAMKLVHSAGKLYRDNDIHLSREGHQIIGRTLFEYLTEHSMQFLAGSHE